MRTQTSLTRLLKNTKNVKFESHKKVDTKKHVTFQTIIKLIFHQAFELTPVKVISKYSFSYYEDEKVRGQFQQPLCVKYKFASAWCLL